MNRRLTQPQTLWSLMSHLPAAGILLAAGLLASCASLCAATEPVDQFVPFDYQSQQDIFGSRIRNQPFLVKQDRNTQADQEPIFAAEVTPVLTLPLMSLSAGKIQGDTAASTEDEQAGDFASDPIASNQPSITELADTLQWTILLLTGAVGIAIGVHRFTKNKHQPQSHQRMEYQGTLPVRGQFSMHLVRISGRQFLVTTDRSGVKTVNALNDWDQFAAPVDLSDDDQFAELQMDSKTRHHG